MPSSEACFQIMLYTLEAGRAFISQNRKPKAFYFVEFVFFVCQGPTIETQCLWWTTVKLLHTQNPLAFYLQKHKQPGGRTANRSRSLHRRHADSR